MTATSNGRGGAAETALFGPARRHGGEHRPGRPAAGAVRLRPSALRASATTRLAVALLLAAGLWLAVAWALDWW